MNTIRIIETPRGFVRENIRAQWVGLEIPLATEAEIKEDPIGKMGFGSEDDGFFVLVSREKAIAALRAAGKSDIADFWTKLFEETYPLGKVLVFERSVCVLV